MLRVLTVTATLVLGLAGPPASPAAGPGAGDLDRAAARSRDALERARRLEQEADFLARTRREAERALRAAGEAAGKVRDGRAGMGPAVPGEALAKARRDIEALLADPRLGQAGRPSSGDAVPAPVIFVSFSMPEASLRALMEEAARAGTALVLRGLVDGSMERTVARIRDLAGPGDAGAPGTPRPALAIDPTLFERFAVDKVPTFVLPLEPLVPCTPEECPVPPHLKVAGAVSLAYALEVMAREATGTALGERAHLWQRRLEDTP